MNPPNTPNIMQKGIAKTEYNIMKLLTKPTIAPYIIAYKVELLLENPEMAPPIITPNMPMNDMPNADPISSSTIDTTIPLIIGINSTLPAISSSIISPHLIISAINSSYFLKLSPYLSWTNGTIIEITLLLSI